MGEGTSKSRQRCMAERQSEAMKASRNAYMRYIGHTVVSQSLTMWFNQHEVNFPAYLVGSKYKGEDCTCTVF